MAVTEAGSDVAEEADVSRPFLQTEAVGAGEQVNLAVTLFSTDLAAMRLPSPNTDGAVNINNSQQRGASRIQNNLAWQFTLRVLQLDDFDVHDSNGVLSRRQMHLVHQLMKTVFSAVCVGSVGVVFFLFTVVLGLISLAHIPHDGCFISHRSWQLVNVWLQSALLVFILIACVVRRVLPVTSNVVAFILCPLVLFLGLLWCLRGLSIANSQKECVSLARAVMSAISWRAVAFFPFFVANLYYWWSYSIVDRLKDSVQRGNGIGGSEAIHLFTEMLGGATPAGEDCVICFGGLEDCDEVDTSLADARPAWRQLICGHYYHEFCLLKWFGKRGGMTPSCPMCRRNLSPSSRPRPTVDVESTS
eukprot:TRINITY_DN27880_c0_g1_i1.p1 TRINITY_DN27880_c0_g1~~TRINITY_DN27880_c0_g1_i1.p1  ORF type:complete len:380 (-),score=44.28 TRINITY_DN27880_c0_g1_i1:61-1140(-)